MYRLDDKNLNHRENGHHAIVLLFLFSSVLICFIYLFDIFTCFAK